MEITLGVLVVVMIVMVEITLVMIVTITTPTIHFIPKMTIPVTLLQMDGAVHPKEPVVIPNQKFPIPGTIKLVECVRLYESGIK